MAEEVDLDQAEILDGEHVVLGYHEPLRRHLEGNEIGERIGGDDDPPGMDAEVPGESHDSAREAEDVDIGLLPDRQIPAFRVPLREVLQIRGAPVGNPAGEPGYLVLAQPVHLGHLPHGHPALERDGRADHGDPVLAVLPVNILQYFFAITPTEIKVDIGRRGALRVEEALEIEVVGEGAHLRESQAVRDQAVRGRPPPDEGHPPLPRLPGDVPHDQEVAAEAHRLDHVELAGSAIPGCFRHGIVPPAEPLEGEVAKERRGCFAFRKGKIREAPGAELQLHVAFVRDPLRVRDGLQAVPEKDRHLHGGFHVVLA